MLYIRKVAISFSQEIKKAGWDSPKKVVLRLSRMASAV
jgi:hypothetical protein